MSRRAGGGLMRMTDIVDEGRPAQVPELVAEAPKRAIDRTMTGRAAKARPRRRRVADPQRGRVRLLGRAGLAPTRFAGLWPTPPQRGGDRRSRVVAGPPSANAGTKPCRYGRADPGAFGTGTGHRNMPAAAGGAVVRHVHRQAGFADLPSPLCTPASPASQAGRRIAAGNGAEHL